MTRWKVDSDALDEREKDFTAHFTCTNLDTAESVKIQLTQEKGRPASDLVGALMVLARVFQRVERGEEVPTDRTVLN